eukprot:GHVR01175931.1.p1 GENE.GHVR01175931.1~~GHVR01175931.1.p1  ORF type:complete len:130 (-),score=6.43 GHVR01175931.1:2324-2713(-)
MVDFLHYQLISSLTSKVNKVLDEDQTCDPTIYFGKGRGVHNLLYYAIANGLYSLPIIMNALPLMQLTASTRHSITSILKENKEEGLQVSLLMTMNCLIGFNKKKEVDINLNDVFLFFNLLQSQSSLCKS